MAHEHELDEWRNAVGGMSEMDRAVTRNETIRDKAPGYPLRADGQDEL